MTQFYNAKINTKNRISQVISNDGR